LSDLIEEWVKQYPFFQQIIFAKETEEEYACLYKSANGPIAVLIKEDFVKLIVNSRSYTTISIFVTDPKFFEKLKDFLNDAPCSLS
jgi:hypothetical protein